MVPELKAKSGSEFDRAYPEHVRHAHDKTIELFESEAKSSEDADLAGFAREMLPTMREHKEFAERLPAG